MTYITDRGDPKLNIKLNSETAPVKVVIDTTSYVKVDAKTGDFIEEYYWNGDMED